MPSTIVLKLIGWGVAGLMLTGMGLWAYRAVQNHFIGIDNIRVELGNERDRANRAEVSLGALEQTVALREQHALALTEIRAESQDKIDEIRDRSNKNKEVLEDKERLKRVAIAKPELVERMSNRATEKVFADLEDIFN